MSNFQPLEDKYQAGDIETSTEKDLETLGKDQSCSNEDGCLMDTPTNIDKFLPSTEKAMATTECIDGDHRVSIDGLKAMQVLHLYPLVRTWLWIIIQLFLVVHPSRDLRQCIQTGK